MPPKALITGATGFIGSHLLETLVEKKWQVACLVRPQSQTDGIQKMPVRILRGQMDSLDFLERAVEGQDYVFHLAARIRPAPPDVYDKANHRLTRDLALACLRKNPEIKRFVYISSISVGGPTPKGLYLDETNPPNPTSEYGRTKLKGELALKEIWDRIPVTIIRPPNVYGARQQETEVMQKLMRTRIVPPIEGGGRIHKPDLYQGFDTGHSPGNGIPAGAKLRTLSANCGTLAVAEVSSALNFSSRCTPPAIVRLFSRYFCRPGR